MNALARQTSGPSSSGLSFLFASNGTAAKAVDGSSKPASAFAALLGEASASSEEEEEASALPTAAASSLNMVKAHVLGQQLGAALARRQQETADDSSTDTVASSSPVFQLPAVPTVAVNTAPLTLPLEAGEGTPDDTGSADLEPAAVATASQFQAADSLTASFASTKNVAADSYTQLTTALGDQTPAWQNSYDTSVGAADDSTEEVGLAAEPAAAAVAEGKSATQQTAVLSSERTRRKPSNQDGAEEMLAANTATATAVPSPVVAETATSATQAPSTPSAEVTPQDSLPSAETVEPTPAAGQSQSEAAQPGLPAPPVSVSGATAKSTGRATAGTDSAATAWSVDSSSVSDADATYQVDAGTGADDGSELAFTVRMSSAAQTEGATKESRQDGAAVHGSARALTTPAADTAVAEGAADATAPAARSTASHTLYADTSRVAAASGKKAEDSEPAARKASGQSDTTIPATSAESRASTASQAAPKTSASDQPATGAQLQSDSLSTPVKTQAPARDIRMEVGSGDSRVEVRVLERGGDVHVAVRTSDSRLAADLRDDLPALAAKLDSGTRTEASNRGESASDGASSRDGGGQGGSQGGDRQDNPRQQQLKDLAAAAQRKADGKDVAWLSAALG